MRKENKLLNQINYQWRITKYNPDFRDENGCYTLEDEWTCPSEIGKIIYGKEFTLGDYFRVEAAYVNTIMTILNECQLNSLRVLHLTKIYDSPENRTSELYEREFDELDIYEDKIVNTNEIRTICTMVLRNFLGCQLYSKDNFFVHFGWDYYMFIGSSVNCPLSIKFAEDNGLFVEEARSPYYFSEEETTRMVEWNEKDDDIGIVIGEEELTGIPLNEFRKIFNLSKDHPVIGSFNITTKEAKSIQKFMKTKIDFSKFEYKFWGGY